MKAVNGNMVTRLCSHRIEYWWEDEKDRELDELSEEYIVNLLIDNYVQGELCFYDLETDTDIGGWWRISQ